MVSPGLSTCSSSGAQRGQARGMGRGRGFHPGGTSLSEGPVDSGSAVDRLGGSRTDVAPVLDGQKRPFSSPPLWGVTESKKNRLLSSPEHPSNLDRDTVSALIEKKIEEFFGPPLLPREHSDDLLWTGPHDPAKDVFQESFPPPYIVLMESTRPGKNLGKYDRLALAECIDLVVRVPRTIFYNGINQVKIQCEDREDA